MKNILAACAVVALAACSAGADEEVTVTEEADDSAASVLEGDAPGFEAVAPGTYQVTRSSGEVDFIEIHSGMTFSRVAEGGEASGGVIFMKDGMTCFLAEGADEEACFTDGPTQDDGSIETTSEAGETSVVMPVDGTLADHADTAQGAAAEAGAE